MKHYYSTIKRTRPTKCNDIKIKLPCVEQQESHQSSIKNTMGRVRVGEYLR